MSASFDRRRLAATGDLSGANPVLFRVEAALRALGVDEDSINWCLQLGPTHAHGELKRAVSQLDENVAAEFGPCVSWDAPGPEDFDGQLVLREWNGEGEELRPKDEGPYRLAALAYRRECGWDSSPCGGLWLCAQVPATATRTEGGLVSYVGTLLGFAAIYDRDEDGEYESLGHLWVARAARRRGVASWLVAEARRRFRIRSVEGPASGDGAHFIAARVRDLRPG